MPFLDLARAGTLEFLAPDWDEFPCLRLAFRALEAGGATVAYAGVVANITGNPAMSVPLWWNGDGLPIGVHFLGRYGDEATLIALSAQLEQARPWAGRTPSVW